MYLHELDEHAVLRKAQRPTSAPPPPMAPRYWEQFSLYLGTRGLDAELARKNRWYPSEQAGDTEPRIVIPATNTTFHGFWQARAMNPHPKRYQSPAVPRGDSIIVVWPWETELARLVVVEGPMDALAAAAVPWSVGVALMGNTPPGSVLDHIAAMTPSLPVLVVGDADAQREAMLVCMGLAMRGRTARTVMLSGVKDLAELPILERIQVLSGEE